MEYDDIIIAPSILSADFARLGEQVQAAEAGGAGWIHIDVMDGRFVPNITMGPLVVEAVHRSTSLPLDVHLMMIEPEHMLPAFADAGADHITVHYEVCQDVYRTVNMIKRLGCKAGIAINPHTRAAVLYEIMPIIDEIMVMTVSPGFGGQSMIEATLPKVARLRAMAADKKRENMPIVTDGGINFDTAPSVAQAGSNVLVVGSAVFNDTSIADNIGMLRDSLKSEEV
ncbi:MAG: ribulose-phosphate 3-epimerase [Chloroflexota bacterium]